MRTASGRYQELTSLDKANMSAYAYSSGGGMPSSEVRSTQNAKDEGRQMTETILKRIVPWDTYQKADLISDRELQLIKRYDKRDRKTQMSLLEEDGVLYLNAFFSLLRSIASEEVVQYILALLDDMISEGGEKMLLLLEEASTGSGNGDTCAILLRMLQRPDWFTQEKSAHILALFLSRDGPQAQAADDNRTRTLHTFVDWLCTELRRPSNDRSDTTAIACLSALLRNRESRQIFVKANGISALTPHLVPTSVTQTLYEACLCVWLLSFVPEAVTELIHLSTPRKLTDIIRVVQKEKVIRVSLMALQKFLETAKTIGPMYAPLLSKLVELGLPKVVKAQTLNSWTDEELLASMEWLGNKLDDAVKLEMSSFEKYSNEVLTATMDWTVFHKEEAFWRKNISNFVAKECAILKALIALLESSSDERTLAVACHDIGQFIAYHPNGRNIVQRLKGKGLVMKLITHPDVEVQKQALMCTQKLMLSKDMLELLTLS